MKIHNMMVMLFGLVLVSSVIGFGGSEEKFIKKYAMMKVYESCFGPQVLKEVRKEMKEAAQKCSGFQPDFDDKYLNHEPPEVRPPNFSEKPYRGRPKPGNKIKTPIHTTDTLLLQQWAEEQKLTDNSEETSSASEESDTQSETMNETENETTPSSSKKPLDISKLEEAIMNIGRPLGHFGHHRPGFTPAASSPNFHQSANIGYYPPMYYPPPPVPYPAPAPAHSYPYHAYYPGYYQPPAPAPAPGNAAYQPYYRGSHRSAKISKEFLDNRTPKEVSEHRTAKDVDVKAQIDAMTFHSGAKMRNITCVMQELGYLDEHLEPNYERMMERINKLHVAEELKKDMIDGVKFCRQFSQCVPETRKDKFQLSKELLRPMFFFRCYKHKKLESCIMKDVRERFSQSQSSSVDDHGTMTNEIRRSFKSNDLASTIFEFMYGSSTEDFETML